jgi:hypothetical protein
MENQLPHEPKSSIDIDVAPNRSFSGTDAIGDGFGFIRQNPKFFVKFFAFTATFITISEVIKNYGKWTDFNYFDGIWGQSIEQTIQTLVSWKATIWWPVAIAGWLVLAIATLSIEAMVYRKALFGKEAGFIGLSMGKDELRLAAAKVLTASPIIVFYALLGFSPLLKSANSLFLVFAVILMIFIGIGVFWASLRLYLASTISQATQKFDLKEIWRETRDKAWDILGVQLLFGLLFAALIIPISLLIALDFSSLSANLSNKAGFISAFRSFDAFIAMFVSALYLSLANIMNILIGVSVYKQMNPDFAVSPEALTNNHE